MEVQQVAKLQLEDEVRAILRHRALQDKQRYLRVRFRGAQTGRRVEERREMRRERQMAAAEREARLESLRRVGRRRAGVDVVPAVKDRFTFYTKVTLID